MNKKYILRNKKIVNSENNTIIALIKDENMYCHNRFHFSKNKLKGLFPSITKFQFIDSRELEKRCGKTFDWNALNQEREVTIREKLKTQKERPGIISFLDDAKKIGLKTAIASSSSKAWVVGWVERLQIKHYFEKFLNRDDVKRIKPAPDLFLASCEALKISTSEALVLEDSENGLKAATAAGIQCAIVTNEITEGGNFSDSVLQTDNFSDNRLKKLLFDL